MARQGERPACFYIILSGTAVVTYGRMTDNHIETVDILERGCTFGVRNLVLSIFLYSCLLQGKRNNDGLTTNFYCYVKDTSGIISSMERRMYFVRLHD